jgi:hypothetical protein
MRRRLARCQQPVLTSTTTGHIRGAAASLDDAFLSLTVRDQP